MCVWKNEEMFFKILFLSSKLTYKHNLNTIKGRFKLKDVQFTNIFTPIKQHTFPSFGGC